ncbi:MAG: IS4 family transposase [Mycoplasma sp.]|nr:IS4 family transposase [Mycoplasma sp.]
MRNIKKLCNVLSLHFNFKKGEIKCFSQIIFAMLKVRTVNLVELSQGIGGNAKLKSKYRRLQRFISGLKANDSDIGKFVFSVFGEVGSKFYLALDRTNWKFGKANINILTLSMVYRYSSLPLLWKMLNKRGNSNTNERIELLKKYIDNFGKDNIGGILADREFIGDKWFKYLMENNIPFYIRLKSSMKISLNKVQFKLSSIVPLLKDNETRTFKNIKLSGRFLNLTIGINSQNELMFVVTNNETENAITVYLKRWNIETLFGFLKTKGFNFEDTHITKLERVSNLFFLLSVAFAWCTKIGEYQNNIDPIKIKKHKRKEISIFRYGLDFIREKLLNPVEYGAKKIISICIKLLSPNMKPLGSY